MPLDIPPGGEKTFERAALLAPRTSVEVALVSGEYLTTAQRRRAREAFGVRVTQAYATADVGLIANECPAQRGCMSPTGWRLRC
jgi:phenylacetate-coenzyme A ligase PaaK-like adenylate-forming protein